MNKSDEWIKSFKVNGEDHAFMYLYGADTKSELKPFIELVKGQGDMYRITKEYGRYHIWDARR